ncbi:hypothetical protein Barb4_00405 [Bacteroidales bacterium Barb4]|nr:hypothetical protein Barb4_00405 [Bacteroidales bacterium Barb4]
MQKNFLFLITFLAAFFVGCTNDDKNGNEEGAFDQALLTGTWTISYSAEWSEEDGKLEGFNWDSAKEAETDDPQYVNFSPLGVITSYFKDRNGEWVKRTGIYGFDGRTLIITFAGQAESQGKMIKLTDTELITEERDGDTVSRGWLKRTKLPDGASSAVEEEEY